MEVEEQDYTDTGGSGVMVSNLPLLFSRGSPSSLCDMYQSELEVFVPFMVRCSVGEERPVPWLHLPRPPWWPKKLPFRMPPSRTALIGLVERCYSFHGCDYLLQFCASLVAQMPPSGYRFNDNRDGTTSMYHGTTGKLLVTFRNENRDYDKFRHGGKGRDATKKLLLSPSSHSGGSGGGGGGGGASTAMFQPPVTDIYLCDKCENEFYSLKEVQAHERHCCGEAPSSPPTPSPEPEIPEEEPEPTGQVPFLSYFNLRPAEHTGLQPHMSPRKKSVSSPPAKLPGPIYPRYESIALTSPLGRYLFAHSKFRNKYQASQHSVMRYERHLHATPNADINFRERCTSRWIVVWRSRKEQQPWVHLYCFNKAQRKERMITLRTGLTRESRCLLRLCRPLAVRVKRLPKRMVDRLLRMGGPTSAPCIDLTDEQQQLEAGHLVPRPLDSQLSCWVGSGGPVGQGNIELQWVPGLPPEQSSMCLPGGSGTFPPHYTTQLGLRNMVGLSVEHNSNINFVSLVPGNTQQQQQQRVLPSGLTIQPSPVSSRATLPLVSNNSHFKAPQNPPVQDGVERLRFPFSADISISPIRAPAAPTHSQLVADYMKPLCKKKFPSHLGSNTQQGRTTIAFPSTQSLPLVPPQPPDWERVVPSTGGEGNSLPRTLSSSIEVIDLSSDEDDFGRVGRGRSEAANAPQQLDGLACYPHTGAKVPSESSDYSSPKNGNSHWSSQQKSHCGAGRVGDLATNGQPPNVLPSPHTLSPILHLPRPQAKRNGQKRKSEEDSPQPRRGKTIILDISSQGVTVSEDGCPLTPTTSVSSDFGLPQRECWRTTEEAVVPVPSLSTQSATVTQTNLASESSNSLMIDEDVSFKTPFQIDEDISFSLPQIGPQESGRLCPEQAPASSQQEAGSSVKFLTKLVTKSMELFKALVGKEKEAVVVSPEAPAGPESCQSAHGAQRSTASAKRSSEVQMLLRDECRELQRGGLRELSHLDPQGIRLTRRSVGRILPVQPSRKTLSSRLSENRPPQRNGSKARREEGRGARKETMGWSSLGTKDPAPQCIDENGNSAFYVRTGPKQPDGRDCLGPMSRVQNDRGIVIEASREWKVGVPTSPSTLEQSDCKFSSGNVSGKSTVFSEISIRNCEALENSCSDVWTNGVTNKLQYTKCSTHSKTNVSPSKSEAEKKEPFPGGVSALRQVNGHASGEERHVCGPKGKALVRAKVRLGKPWHTGHPSASVGGIKVINLPSLDKDVPSLNQTSALVRPELMGETAEECGAQLALCPLPDQLHHHPGGSGSDPSTPLQRPRLTLLNSIRKENFSPGKYPNHSQTPEQEPQQYLCPPAKPQSTNRRKKSRLHRELISLGRDEWKEIQGTGFHPSDLVGQEEVKYLSVSSDEDEAPSPSRILTPSPPPQARGSSARDRKPLLSAKVSREVAMLLGDECKELRGRVGRPPKSHQDRDKERVRWRSMHPLASLAHSINELTWDTRELGSTASRCSTRLKVNTHPVVEVFTPRDSHRHLLRSEVAMCVLNYELPNIH